MKIPMTERLSPDIRVPKGPRKGEHRFYKTALLNTLIHLYPRHCLEIGTWRGGSAKIFERYFDEHRPDGTLVTADIRRYKDVASDRVHQVLVYPHDLGVFQLHRSVKEEHLIPGWRYHLASSVEDNAAIVLRGIMAPAFDFVFVDGDHRHLLKDLEIVKLVTKSPHYALLDDTQTGIWDCGRVYHDDVKHRYGHYDFDDWPIFTGTSLIWEKP